MKLFKIAAATMFLSLSFQALADVTLKSEVFREVEVADKNGKKTKKLEAVERAVPGQELIYVLTYRNTGKQPANSVVLNNPLPEALAYRVGSAKGNNARIEYSVDGGKQYAAWEALSIKNADGTVRAVTGNDVTHIRWTLSAAIKAGAEGNVSYRAVLK